MSPLTNQWINGKMCYLIDSAFAFQSSGTVHYCFKTEITWLSTYQDLRCCVTQNISSRCWRLSSSYTAIRSPLWDSFAVKGQAVDPTTVWSADNTKVKVPWNNSGVLTRDKNMEPGAIFGRFDGWYGDSDGGNFGMRGQDIAVILPFKAPT